MSEWKWIDRREREPEEGTKVFALWDHGGTGQLYWLSGSLATHWMPIPPAPQKMVTIEIGEEVAKEYAKAFTNDFLGTSAREIAVACRRALEGK